LETTTKLSVISTLGMHFTVALWMVLRFITNAYHRKKYIYVDFTSLYPYVNKVKKYPIGHRENRQNRWKGRIQLAKIVELSSYQRWSYRNILRTNTRRYISLWILLQSGQEKKFVQNQLKFTSFGVPTQPHQSGFFFTYNLLSAPISIL